MRLVDLEPRWVAEFSAPDDTKQGVSFLCPHCRARRLAIFFDLPICGAPPANLKQVHRDVHENDYLADHHIGRVLWHREGDSFETLTLTPSIDASAWGCWHGFITKGEVQ